MTKNSTNVRFLSALLSGIGAVSPRAAGRIAFQLHGLMLGFHHARRLLRQRGAEAMARQSFEQLLAQAMPAR